MIKVERMIEILHQKAERDYLRSKGEMEAYEDFLSSDFSSLEKAYDYLVDERSLAEIEINDINTGYNEWNILMGRLSAYDHLEKGLIDHGE